MNPNVRKGVYTALVVLNTALAVCVAQNAVPAAYASYAALASLVVAALMKEFAAPVLPAAPPPGAP